MNEQFRETQRREKVKHYADQIERAKVMAAYAANNQDFAQHERDQLAKDIVDYRRSILAALTTTELSELGEKRLQPEQAA
jgi:hypothetical protein